MVKFRFYDPDDKAKSPPAATPVLQPSAASVAPPPKQVISARNSGFTLHWVHELHWHKNPFTELQPKPAHVFIVNQDAARQHINLFFIKEKQFGTISGAPGSGKTFMLRWLAEELQPYGERFAVFGFEGSTTVESFVEKLASAHHSLLVKYKGTTPEELSIFLSQRAKRRIVILIDNADALAEQVQSYCKQLLAHNNTVVILTGKNPPKLGQEELSVHLQPLTPDDAEKLLEKRIAAVGGKGITPFTAKLVAELWKASNQNTKQFLDFCNETAMKIALKQFTVPSEEPTQLDEQKKKPVVKTKTEPKSTSPYDDLIAGLVK